MAKRCCLLYIEDLYFSLHKFRVNRSSYRAYFSAAGFACQRNIFLWIPNVAVNSISFRVDVCVKCRRRSELGPSSVLLSCVANLWFGANSKGASTCGELVKIVRSILTFYRRVALFPVSHGFSIDTADGLTYKWPLHDLSQITEHFFHFPPSRSFLILIRFLSVILFFRIEKTRWYICILNPIRDIDDNPFRIHQSNVAWSENIKEESFYRTVESIFCKPDPFADA